MDPTTIPWVQLGLGGSLAVFQGWMLWKLLFKSRPEEAKEWRDTIGGLTGQIGRLSERIDAVLITSLDRMDAQEQSRRKEARDMMERIDRMEDNRREELKALVEGQRAETRELVTRHAAEMREKRHEFLNAQTSLQNHMMDVLRTVTRQAQEAKDAANETREVVRQANSVQGAQ